MSLCAFTGAQGKAAAVRVRNLLQWAISSWLEDLGSQDLVCFLLPANQGEKFVKQSRKER